MMQVQVNGEDISPEEFLEGNGWCTIRYKTQSNRETAQSNTQNGAHSHTGEGVNGNRQRSRQQQRNVKRQVIRNSKMPLLPRSDFKIVIRPRGGLDVATTGTVRLASAIYRAANVPAQDAGEDTVCSNNRQNIIILRRQVPLEIQDLQPRPLPVPEPHPGLPEATPVAQSHHQKDRNERHRDHREGELGRCGQRKTSTNREGWRQNTR
ncbi:hypothetical protein HPB49_024928 [Dermacentor silvarum]|uniref:Uncharacterized protein n=1 Tax=Dermacentor silvarum TaxID=543639 RepID=A0ACB8D942_DERSI|nr:hypothetical protein HPB49_024928 [Dermacentor silvarum]